VKVLVSLLVLAAVSGCSGGHVTVEAAAQDGIGPPLPVVARPSFPPEPPALPRGCSRLAAACVSTASSVAWLQHDGTVSYGPVPVALGRASQATPHGTFHVAWKDQEHTSSRYGIDMPYSTFFAAGGIAFHQGPLDVPSHGCVHLTHPAAVAFFSALERGDRVEVF
jgi:hypothetical protein